MVGAGLSISRLGLLLCIILLFMICILWDKMDRNKMLDNIFGRLCLSSCCLMFLLAILAGIVEVVCLPSMEWNYNKPVSIEKVVALQDNNLSEYRYYGRRTYINEQLYYQYMVDVGNAYKANQIPANNTILYYDNDYPRVEWYNRSKNVWIFRKEEPCWKMYVPEGAIIENFSVDFQ